MSEKIIVQYLGFESRASARAYTFRVREDASEPLDYTLSIENEAFVSHQASYQNGPDICSLKLRRELACFSNHPPRTQYDITPTELKEYFAAHAEKKVRKFGRPEPE